MMGQGPRAFVLPLGLRKMLDKVGVACSTRGFTVSTNHSKNKGQDVYVCKRIRDEELAHSVVLSFFFTSSVSSMVSVWRASCSAMATP